MLRRIPFHKAYLLAALAVLLTVSAMRFAFWPTIQAWHTNKDLNQKLLNVSDLSYQPDYLARKNGNLKKALALYHADSLTYRSNVISVISALAEKEGVKVVDVPTKDGGPHYETANYKIQQFTLEGNYSALTGCFNQVQLSHGIGLIRSAQYLLTGKDKNLENKKILNLKLFLEVGK